MNLSERNRKVAISRWNKILTKEKEMILSNEEGVFLKSAICGFLAGDGSVQKINVGNYTRYQIDFFPDDKVMLKTYVDFIKRVYNKTPTIGRRDNMFTVRINSKTIGEDLLNGAKFGLRNWEIPLAMLSNRKLKRCWVRAFFSAEGFVNKKTIKIQTINQKGMNQLSNLLNKLSIKHKCYLYDSKKKNYSKVYIIRINTKEARKKFYYDIGFWHSDKMKTLKKSLLPDLLMPVSHNGIAQAWNIP